jgi:D-galactarolactone isomerase
VAPLAQFLAKYYADRCLWASNWPHPNTKPEPSNTALLDWALGCVPDESKRRKMPVDNPAELYGF